MNRAKRNGMVDIPARGFWSLVSKAAPAACVAGLLLAAGGCAVDEKKEVAQYRKILDGPGARPVSYTPGEGLSLQTALLLANQNNEQLAISGETYIQSLINKDRAIANFLPTLTLGPATSPPSGRAARAVPAPPASPPAASAPSGRRLQHRRRRRQQRLVLQPRRHQHRRLRQQHRHRHGHRRAAPAPPSPAAVAAAPGAETGAGGGAGPGRDGDRHRDGHRHGHRNLQRQLQLHPQPRRQEVRPGRADQREDQPLQRLPRHRLLQLHHRRDPAQPRPAAGPSDAGAARHRQRLLHRLEQRAVGGRAAQANAADAGGERPPDPRPTGRRRRQALGRGPSRGAGGADARLAGDRREQRPQRADAAGVPHRRPRQRRPPDRPDGLARRAAVGRGGGRGSARPTARTWWRR